MDSKKNVWALFTDGTASRVVISKWDADNMSSLELAPVGVENIETRTSANKAITSSYGVLRSLNRIPPGGCCFNYEFGDTSQVVEASASLAFALEVVRLMEGIPFSIAATGIVPESSPTAVVESVKGINEKIDAAIEKLSSGEMVFFPAGNLDDLKPITENTAREKGVVLQPVKTVEEAVNTLLAAGTPDIEEPIKKKTSWRPWLFFPCLLAAALAVAFYIFNPGDIQPPTTPVTIESPKPVSPAPATPTPQELSEPTTLERLEPIAPGQSKLVSLVKAKPAPQKQSESAPPGKPEPNSPAPAKPDSQPPAEEIITQKPIITAHKSAPDLEISPKPEKKPKLEKSPVRPRRPLHIKIALDGPDDLAVSAVHEAIASKLRSLGYIIDAEDFDGVLSAAVRLTEGEEIPLRPHAGDSEILVQRDLIIEKLAYKPRQGRRRTFSHLSVPVDTTKDRADGWRDQITLKIFEGKNKPDFSGIDKAN